MNVSFGSFALKPETLAAAAAACVALASCIAWMAARRPGRQAFGRVAAAIGSRESKPDRIAADVEEYVTTVTRLIRAESAPAQPAVPVSRQSAVVHMLDKAMQDMAAAAFMRDGLPIALGFEESVRTLHGLLTRMDLTGEMFAEAAAEGAFDRLFVDTALLGAYGDADIGTERLLAALLACDAMVRSILADHGVCVVSKPALAVLTSGDAVETTAEDTLGLRHVPGVRARVQSAAAGVPPGERLAVATIRPALVRAGETLRRGIVLIHNHAIWSGKAG